MKKKQKKILKKIYTKFKRVLDFTLALLLLIALSPIIIVTSILIKLDSEGPVFFRQTRSGKNNIPFKIYKFRSMVATNDVANFKEEDKSTKVGRIIRKLSIDEIPQLINILKGEMSFIGPRPWITEYSKYFNEDQMKRLDVLPGITGLAQCSGRNGITINQKINYDIQYVENISLKMDICVIFKTIKTVLARESVDAGKKTIQNELQDLRKQFYKKNAIHIVNAK